MLSLLTAPVAAWCASVGSVGFAGSVVMPPLTPSSDFCSLSALVCAFAQAAASAAAVVCLATLPGSAAAAAAEAVALSQRSLAISFARATVAAVVIACVPASSAG